MQEYNAPSRAHRTDALPEFIEPTTVEVSMVHRLINETISRDDEHRFVSG